MQVLLPPYPIAALPDLPVTLRTGLDVLRRATGHFLIVVHRYEMYRTLARDPDFVTHINRTTAAAGLNTIRGALAASLVVSLAALFDQNSDATSLARALNAILASADAVPFATLHLAFTPPIDTGRALDGLRRLRARLSRTPLSEAISRLRDLRNQDVAHLDVDLSFLKGPAKTGDIDMVYTASANIIVKANRFCGINIGVSNVRAEARSQAVALCQSVQPCPL